MSNAKFLKRSEVARLFGVSPPTVTRWAHQGRLPSLRTPGGQWRYDTVAVERLLREAKTEKPATSQ